MTQDPDRNRAFFGRVKGKKLRSGQEASINDLLPQLRVNPELGPDKIFDRPMKELWIEIGFGGGEHLAHRARENPDVGIIGCEPFINGMAKLLVVVDNEKLDNIRVWERDATELLPLLPEASFQTIYLLYPDPWPKRPQRKRRFISDQTLEMIARLLVKGGQFRFATDIDNYAGWGLARIMRSSQFRWTAERPDDWRKPWANWPGTRYEAKAIREGRVPSYMTFERI
ncbi:tRNA (guanine(46)-N(7))-methyltransferase TrmB [Microvirga sp. W0021]|uniref:tRNA (guanine-N(7)-)-methyltransferase n=1 Tax=Hohaiivirga grylli TaxID=3133970 RepID=A0ABV0BFI2_9HYPH